MNNLLSWIYGLGIVALLCTSCTDDTWRGVNPTDRQTDAAGYYFVLKEGRTQTRIAYPNYQQSFFEEGDAVGIFALTGEGTTGNPYVLAEGTKGNEMYVVKNIMGTAKVSGMQVLEPAKSTIPLPQGPDYTYVVYYPYTAGLTFNQLTSLRKLVKDNQNDPGSRMHYFEQSDLLWDVVKEAVTGGGVQQVDIVMEHAFSTIVVEVSGELVDDIPVEPFTKANAVVTLLGMDTTAVDINLTAKEKAELNYTVKTETPKPEIAFWDFGVGSSGNRAFVAVVPSGQSIPANTPFLRIRDRGASTGKEYQTKQAIQLKPGEAYIFSVMKTHVESPEPDDDDTWVYDVINPDDGKLAGLLCREYLRYQPDITDGTKPEKHTGTDYTDGQIQTKYINSQAWVFYPMKGLNTPNLNKGTVVRFIYDLETDKNFKLWPAPHIKKNMEGIFAPKHGYQWADTEESTGWDHGKESEKPENIHEYYMHGGTIAWKWDPVQTKSIISSFTMPDAQITNEKAARGHIVIGTGGEPSVSYENSKTGEKAALLIPHFLVDRRKGKDGKTVVNRYPLVKIGYNQFWMTKSLRATVLTDGTPLTCYNHATEANVSFASGTILQAGYIYPFGQTNNQMYDPYHDPAQMEPAESSYRPAPMFNRMAIESDLLLPESEGRNTLYLAPAVKDMEEVVNYVGYAFASKMNTDIQTYTNDKFSEDALAALCKGKIIHENANFYTVNICGLNLKPQGFYDGVYSGTAVSNLGGTCTLLLKSDISERPAVSYFTIEPYDGFKVSNDKSDFIETLYGKDNPSTMQYSYGVFAPIRFIMKFRNQDDTGGGVSVTATRAETGEPTPSGGGMYVPLEECKSSRQK